MNDFANEVDFACIAICILVSFFNFAKALLAEDKETKKVALLWAIYAEVMVISCRVRMM